MDSNQWNHLNSFRMNEYSPCLCSWTSRAILARKTLPLLPLILRLAPFRGINLFHEAVLLITFMHLRLVEVIIVLHLGSCHEPFRLWWEHILLNSRHQKFQLTTCDCWVGNAEQSKPLTLTKAFCHLSSRNISV